MRRLAACFVALLAAGTLRAATLSTDLGGVFDDVGVGTRPLGMGGAFTAVADDGNAAEENPAGMAFFDPSDRFATFSHSDLYGLSFLSRDFVAYAQGDQGYTAVGLSFNQLSVSLNPGEWNEDAFEYSGAKQVYGFGEDAWAKLSLGWQFKYLRVTSDLSQDSAGTSVGGGDADGWGSGFGAMLKLGPKVSLGLMVQDLYSTLTWSTGNVENIPTTVKEGAAYRYDPLTLVSVEVREEQGSDVQNPDGMGLSSWHVGGERWFLDGQSEHLGVIKNVGVRAGYYEQIQNQDSGVLTAGASLKADVWEVDYTYEFDLGSDTLGNTQRFGLGIKF
ncbi:MAG TPA: hypothetical protein VK914_12085 [bacterium]|jgi:hypothetical protein|nr:hypothetical protein [bacterium]